MDYDALKNELLTLAIEYSSKGPGYSQQGSVLRDALAKFQIGAEPGRQQRLLTCWDDLFRDGLLSWGYNVDNPGPPFFHIPDRSFKM